MTRGDLVLPGVDQLGLATHLASIGYWVFPVEVREADRPGMTEKTPKVKWRDASTMDTARIAQWWAPGAWAAHCHVGIDTGKSGVILVDLDVHPGKDGTLQDGPGEWARLMAAPGGEQYPHPQAAVATHSGGWHLYYRAAPGDPVSNSASAIAGGVDTRGVGGFAMAWAGNHLPVDQLPELPAIARVLLRSTSAKTEAPGRSTHPPAPDASRTGRAGAVETGRFSSASLVAPRDFTEAEALAFCSPSMDGLESAPGGSINQRLFLAATTIWHFCDVFWPREQVRDWLIGAQRKAWLASGGSDDGDYASAEQTIDSAWSGLDSGGRSPGDAWRAAVRAETPSAPPPFPGAAGTAALPAGDDAEAWAPSDLTDILNGTYIPAVPEVGHRSDGKYLLYPGKEHYVAAEPESGKTWLIVLLCVQTLARVDGRVLYVDFEDEAGAIIPRMLQLGAEPGVLGDRSRFAYVRPNGPAGPAYAALVAAMKPTLTVFDGVTEGYAINGLDPEKNADVPKWRHRMVIPALNAGSATLASDHVIKSRDGRGGFAIGAGHKKAGLTGAALELRNIHPFGRGLKGSSELIVTKDRPGMLRQIGVKGEGRESIIGDLVLNDTGDQLICEIYPKIDQKLEDGTMPQLMHPGVAAIVQVMKTEPEGWWSPRRVGDEFMVLKTSRLLTGQARLAGQRLLSRERMDALTADGLLISRPYVGPGRRPEGTLEYRLADPQADHEATEAG